MNDETMVVEVPASEEVQDQGKRDGIKAILDGIDGLRKAGLSDHPAMDNLTDDLARRIADFGRAVARSNTVYAPVGEGMVTVNVDPKVLTRL